MNERKRSLAVAEKSVRCLVHNSHAHTPFNGNDCMCLRIYWTEKIILKKQKYVAYILFHIVYFFISSLICTVNTYCLRPHMNSKWIFLIYNKNLKFLFFNCIRIDQLCLSNQFALFVVWREKTWFEIGLHAIENLMHTCVDTYTISV